MRQRSAAATGGEAEVPVRGQTARPRPTRLLSMGKPPGKSAGVSGRLPLRGSPQRGEEAGGEGYLWDPSWRAA